MLNLSEFNHKYNADRGFTGFCPDQYPLFKNSYDNCHVAWSIIPKWTTERLFWNTQYSIPLSWFERIFTQKTWDAIELEATELPSELEAKRHIRRNVLHPDFPFDPRKHSRRAWAAWNRDPAGKLEWSIRYYGAYQRGLPLRKGVDYDKRSEKYPDVKDMVRYGGYGVFDWGNPDSYPYVDPYWDDGAKPFGSRKTYKYGVELEVIFAFTMYDLKYAKSFLVQHDHSRHNVSDGVQQFR